MNGHVESCGSCRFWKRHKDGQPSGMCRQKPPAVIMIGMQPHPIAKNQGMPIVDSFWPPIPESEWCGQWSAAAKTYADIDLSKLGEVSRA